MGHINSQKQGGRHTNRNQVNNGQPQNQQPRVQREPRFEVLDPGGDVPSSQERKTLDLELRSNKRGVLAVIGEHRETPEGTTRSAHIFAPADTMFGLILGLVAMYRGHLDRDKQFAAAEQANGNDLAAITGLIADPSSDMVSSNADLVVATEEPAPAAEPAPAEETAPAPAEETPAEEAAVPEAVN